MAIYSGLLTHMLLCSMTSQQELWSILNKPSAGKIKNLYDFAFFRQTASQPSASCLACAISLTKQTLKLLKSPVTPPITFLLCRCLTKRRIYRKQSADDWLMKLEIKPTPFTRVQWLKVGLKVKSAAGELQRCAAPVTSLQLLMLMTVPSFRTSHSLCFICHCSRLGSLKLPSKCHFMALLTLHIFSYFWVFAHDILFLPPLCLNFLSSKTDLKYHVLSKVFPDHPGWNDLLLSLFFLKNIFSFSNREWIHRVQKPKIQMGMQWSLLYIIVFCHPNFLPISWFWGLQRYLRSKDKHKFLLALHNF